MDNRFRMRLYLITGIACAAWFAQTAREALGDGTLRSAPTLILLACIAIAAGYTGVNAVLLWRNADDSAGDAGGDGVTSESGDAADTNDDAGTHDTTGAADTTDTAHRRPRQ